MELFDQHFLKIKQFMARKQQAGKVSCFPHQGPSLWPRAETGNLVLGKDTAVELGNPKTASTSFMLWTNHNKEVSNGRISLVGPDLNQTQEAQLPFGKIVIVGGSDFDVNNCYDRYRELERLRYDIQLNGYMMRGVSQYQREWSRISNDAIQNGFSLRVLGAELVEKFSALDYVHAVEIIFITSDNGDVVEMQTVSDDAARIIGAMNKMSAEMSFDCDTCEYTDVCEDVAELRSMRRTMENKEGAAYA